MPQIDLGQVVGPQGAQGEPGPQGAQGIQGPAGPAATINGVNALTIEAGDNIELSQSGSTTTLSVPTDAVPTEDSTKPVQSGGVAAALSNKAPAGYGLGGNAIMTDSPDYNLDNISGSGWFVGAPKMDNFTFGSCLVENIQWAAGEGAQIAFLYPGTSSSAVYNTRIQRTKFNYAFGPWEWINPPMQLGIEYRTTERYNGKPVFVMAVDGGVFPNSSSKTIEVQIPDTSGQVKMLDCYGVLDNGTQIPGLLGKSVFDASNYLGLFTQNGNGKFTISVGSGRNVGMNFTLFLKYWKEGT